MAYKKAYRYRISLDGHEPVEAVAPDRLRAVIAAAIVWHRRWTEIARDCEVEDLGAAQPISVSMRGRT